MSNLFVSYDLHSPGQNYDTVIKTIKSLGDWAHIHESYWYLKSQWNAQQVAETIWTRMDKNDSLMIIDACNNDCYWFNLPQEVENLLQSRWNATIRHSA